MIKFFDSHSHYQDEKFDEDRDEALKDAFNQNITKIIIPGWNLESSKHAIQIANKYDFAYAAIGVHPSDANEKEDLKELYELAKNKKAIAIGEIGLDYHYENINKDIQKQYFINQIEIANDLNLPIIIHTRDAIYDTLEIVKNNKCKNTGVFHCCPHNIELIKEALKIGYYISFSGTITFKNAKGAQEAVNMVPSDKLLIETDSPYLSPEPYRGRRNNSINVKLTAQKVAEYKNISIEDIAQKTYENAKRLFKIN